MRHNKKDGFISKEEAMNKCLREWNIVCKKGESVGCCWMTSGGD